MFLLYNPDLREVCILPPSSTPSVPESLESPRDELVTTSPDGKTLRRPLESRKFNVSYICLSLVTTDVPVIQSRPSPETTSTVHDTPSNK